MEELVSHYPEFDAFLIDMAVGLRTSADQLRPDDLARKELGQKSSSIFPIPCRQAVYADSEEEQKQTNIRILGKSLSKQTVHIIPKIRELDEFLIHHPEYKNRILESHPEVDFARLNGSVVMTRKKAYPGFSDRAAILKKYLPGKDLWDKTFPKSDKVDHCKVPFVNRSAVLVMHGDKAHSCYFGRDAYANMVKDSKYTDNKELLIIPGASHTDLYDGGENHAIPFDKLESFFTEYLK